MCFSISKEFIGFPVTNWLSNQAWFNIELLVDAYADNFVSLLSKNTYSKSIKQVLLQLGLPALKMKHLGQGLGHNILKLLEDE